MNKDPNFQKILKNIRDDGYAECKDQIVRDLLRCKRLSSNHLKSISQSLSNELNRPVQVLSPSKNYRDFYVRFFCADMYISQTAKPELSKRQSDENYEDILQKIMRGSDL